MQVFWEGAGKPQKPKCWENSEVWDYNQTEQFGVVGNPKNWKAEKTLSGGC